MTSRGERIDKVRSEILRNTREYAKLSLRRAFTPGIDAVPASGKSYDAKELCNGVEAVLDGWWTEGKYSDSFSSKLSKTIGLPYIVLVNSGSSANFLAFFSLTSHLLDERRLKAGDEVITVAACFPTTVNPIIQAGCVPVFVDVELGTYNINTAQLQKALSKKTRAIFIAHTLGNPFDLQAVHELAEENDLWLIEDCCDALGARYSGKHVGAYGDLATFSFYPAHQITTGEGGAIATSNHQLHRILLSMRDWGRDCMCRTGQDNACGKRFEQKQGALPYGYDHKYIYSHMGYNLKMTDLQAAIGDAQIDKLDYFVSKRNQNFEKIYAFFKKYEKFFYLPKKERNSNPSWFGFTLTIRENAPFDRKQLLDFLDKNKVGTRLLFGGNITKQPYFLTYKPKSRVVDQLKNTDLIMNNSFWIGVQPNLSEEKIKYVQGVFERFLSKYAS